MKWNSDRNEIAWLSLYVTQSFKGSSSGGKVVQEGTQNTRDSRMVWRYFQRLSYVRSFSSVEENTEDEREPEKNPTSKLGSLLRSKANWTNSRYSHVSVYFCQHAHWLCISCFFSKFSEVCSSNKHQLLIELASPIVFYFNGDSLQGSAAYSLHCSAQCSYVAPCHTSPFTEAVTFISMKRINRSESRVCSAFGGVECKLKASQGCNVGNAEKKHDAVSSVRRWSTGFYSRY